VSKTKVISLDFLQQKFDEFFNKRQNTPILKIRLSNDNKESYIEVFFIDAAEVDGYASISKKYKDISNWAQSYYFNDINSKSITINITPEKQTFLELKIEFETDNTRSGVELPNDANVLPNLDFLRFSITLRFTLSITNGKIDLMSWIDDIDQLRFTSLSGNGFRVLGQFLGKPVSTSYSDITPDFFIRNILINQIIEIDLDISPFDPLSQVERTFRGGIFDSFRDLDPNTNETGRDSFNNLVSRWLLGGDGKYKITDLKKSGSNLIITYEVPQDVLNPGFLNAGVPNKPGIDPPMPDWPNEAINPDSIFDFSPSTLSNINHIVVVTMENRSFDHLLGYLSLPINKGGMGRTDVDGLTESHIDPHKPFPSFPLTETLFSPDPGHSYEPVFSQINGGEMDGFVKSYAKDGHAPVPKNIMGYHTGINVPVYDALARDFSIGHRWFSSHPGPTFSNRFYELTGRLNITNKFSKQNPNLNESNAAGYWEYSNSNPLSPVFTRTIFDALDEYNHQFGEATWNYFEDGYCFLRFFENHTFNNENIINIFDPERGFFAKVQNGTLPSVSFIDPHYIELPPNANCDGPPADIKDGQLFIERIVEAVITGPKWEKTLLVIIYDEHGGFYDHVAPPSAKKFADDSADYPLGSYGIRVPAFVVSPWVNQGEVFGYDGIPSRVSSLYFDHTSILNLNSRLQCISPFLPLCLLQLLS